MSNDNQYADRDAMWLDQQGGHYIRHVDHMTREGLHSKSDIAAELGWRDLQIQELTQQLSAKTISEQNIINAFDIKGEGAHSKLVIEYMHGLVAENSALKGAIEFAEPWLPSCDGELLHIISQAKITPATEAFTAELRAQGVDALALHMEFNGYSNEASGAREYAANLRAGRKG